MYDAGSSSSIRPPGRAHAHRNYSPDPSSEGPYDDPPPSSDDFSSPAKKPKRDHAASSEVAHFGDTYSGASSNEMDTDTSLEGMDMDAFDNMDDVEEDLKPKPTPIPKEEPKKWFSVYDSLNVAESTLSSKVPTVTPNNVSALEPDGSLRFYWLDCMEEKGKLYFTGKLKDKTSGSWVSCCITVEGIQRNLYLLPWEQRQEVTAEGELVSTDVVPTSDDVYDDFDNLRQNYGIKSFKAKDVQRKYAFGEEEVPRDETTWTKVLYSFEGQTNENIPLLMDLHVFQRKRYPQKLGV